jgi:DNA-binding response OmpR family regulator
MSATRPILIVEDDDALRQVLADQVASSGVYQSIEAATLDEASRFLGAAEARFDSIILDINLPDGDGRDFCAQLRKLGHTMPIIMLTGSSTEDDVVSGLNAGANDYIAKPFRANELLARLQAQLRPHFLFNTLNTVSSLMHSDVGRADRLLTRLADLLRASLGAGETDTVSLREELRLLRLYAEIMEERFSGRVTTDWQIADDTLPIRVPAMLLQPLLENAFKYGVEQTMGAQHIRIVVSRDQDRLHLKIHNTGSVLHPGWREGIGLANCRERLRVLHGDAATVDICNDGTTGVETSISLPLDIARP